MPCTYICVHALYLSLRKKIHALYASEITTIKPIYALIFAAILFFFDALINGFIQTLAIPYVGKVIYDSAYYDF